MIDFVPPRLAGTWQQVLRRRAPLGRALAEWLPARRWFAGKAGVIAGVEIEQVRPLDSTTIDAALLVVAVTFEGGDQHHYNVPVVRRPEGWGVPGAVIAALDDHHLLYDAMLWDNGCRAVVGAALTASGAHSRRNRLGWTATATMRPVGVEQSNSSVIVGRTLIAKLIRRLEPGRNPDAELPELLRSNGFPHAPGVAGTLDIELDDGTAEAVIVHDMIPNEGDLWTWMLGALADGRFADTTRIVRLLGKRTAEMHHALATAGTTTASLTWQRALFKSVQRELRATGRLVSDTSRPRARHDLI